MIVSNSKAASHEDDHSP